MNTIVFATMRHFSRSSRRRCSSWPWKTCVVRTLSPNTCDVQLESTGDVGVQRRDKKWAGCRWCVAVAVTASL